MPEPALTRARLILCESGADAAFLRALIAARGIEPYDVRDTIKRGGGGGGNSWFGRTLESLVIPLAESPTTHILIISDADAEPEETFKLIIEQVKGVKASQQDLGKLGCPNAPYLTAKGKPALGIYLIPGTGQCGNLECLAFEAAKGAHACNAALVETLAADAGVDQWSANSQGKMKLKTLFACTHSASPDIGLGNLWSQGGDYLLDLHDSVLDDLAKFLADFGA